MKKCARCLAPTPGKLCRACVASELRHARTLAERAQAKDEFGAVRNGEGKGIPKVALPLGSVTIRLDLGIPSRYVKVRMGGRPGSRFVQYGKWWWEKNKGPVPKGLFVLHADGDLMNDDPKNFVLGTSGMKLVLAHQRDEKWSREQHRRAAAGCAERNRKVGRINRAENFLKQYWYPVVEAMGVILNVPFRRRKRLLASFGSDISRYPKSGGGKHPTSEVQKALRFARVKPVRSADLSLRRFSTYCLLDPLTGQFQGPMGHTKGQIIAQLEGWRSGWRRRNTPRRT